MQNLLDFVVVKITIKPNHNSPNLKNDAQSSRIKGRRGMERENF